MELVDLIDLGSENEKVSSHTQSEGCASVAELMASMQEVLGWIPKPPRGQRQPQAPQCRPALNMDELSGMETHLRTGKQAQNWTHWLSDDLKIPALEPWCSVKGPDQ